MAQRVAQGCEEQMPRGQPAKSRLLMVRRLTSKDSARMKEVADLVKNEPELIRRGQRDVLQYLRESRLVGIYSVRSGTPDELICVSIGEVHRHCDPRTGQEIETIEVGLTVVREDFRNHGICRIAASVIKVMMFADHDCIDYLIATFRPGNEKGKKAIMGNLATVMGLAESLHRHAGLQDFISMRLAKYRALNWTMDPGLALFGRQCFEVAVARTLDMASDRGFSKDGFVYRLDRSSWDRDGFFDYLNGLKDGWRPEVTMWRETAAIPPDETEDLTGPEASPSPQRLGSPPPPAVRWTPRQIWCEPQGDVARPPSVDGEPSPPLT